VKDEDLELVEPALNASDPVEQASKDSFPASDPPSWATLPSAEPEPVA
jgi:hypothetical protein